MGLASKMPEIRDLVFGTIGDVMSIGTSDVKGKFFRRYREVALPDGQIAGLDLSFDCNVSDEVLALAEDDEVEIDGTTYRFCRHVPPGGDDSGLITCELKRA